MRNVQISVEPGCNNEQKGFKCHMGMESNTVGYTNVSDRPLKVEQPSSPVDIGLGIVVMNSENA